MEIEIVKTIQSFSNKFLDVVFWLITKMGEETFFLILLSFVYIAYSDKFALKLLFVYLISVGINSLIKWIIKRPRPYIVSNQVMDRLHYDGYSFPSGHSQGYFVTMTTGLFEIKKSNCKKNIKIFVILLTFLFGLGVMISRLYWGQHFLTDVIAGMILGVLVSIILCYFFDRTSQPIKKVLSIKSICFFLTIISFGVFVVTATLYSFTNVDLDKIYKFAAVIISIGLGMNINNRFIHYKSNQGFVMGVLKCLILLACYIFLYYLINLMIDIKGIICFFVYLILGMICTILLPLLFKRLFKKGY